MFRAIINSFSTFLQNAAHVFASKLDSLSSLNPLLLQQQLLQQLVVNGQGHLGQSSSTQLHHIQQQTRQEQSKQDHPAQLHLSSANVVDQTVCYFSKPLVHSNELRRNLVFSSAQVLEHKTVSSKIVCHELPN